jgi:DNA-binding NarL/FixJ family response regulator
MTTEILLVDDQELMRMGFRMVIDSQADLVVVGEASNGHEAIEVTQRLRPDVILMDVRMPEMDGVEATRLIVESDSETRIIILTTFDLDEYVYAALRAGASGFLLKDTPPADLLSAIRAVANGDAVVAPRVTRRLLHLLSPSAVANEHRRGCPRTSRAADGARARGSPAGRSQPLERRNRRTADALRSHCQVSRRSDPLQIGFARPSADRRLRVRDGTHHTRSNVSRRAPEKVYVLRAG